MGVADICEWRGIFVEYFKEVGVLCLPFGVEGSNVYWELDGVGSVWEVYSVDGIIYCSFGG